MNRIAGIRFVLFATIVLLVLPPTALAAVVINEISSAAGADWVELTNTATVSADLTGLRLRDDGDRNKKDLSGGLEPGEFTVIKFSNYLNKSGDTVRLLKVTGQTEDLVDSVIYGGTDGICAPGTGQTIGRLPDSVGGFFRLTDTTQGTANSTADIIPCVTPSPTTASQPTPTKTVSKAVSSVTYTPTSAPTPSSTTHSAGAPTDDGVSSVRNLPTVEDTQPVTPVQTLSFPPEAETLSTPSVAGVSDQVRRLPYPFSVRLAAGAAIAAAAAAVYTTYRTRKVEV